MVIEVGSSCLHSERSTSHGNHPALCDSRATHIDVHHTASSPVYIVHYPLMLFLASANTKDNDLQSGDLRNTCETLCYKFLVLIIRLSRSHACVSLNCYWSLILLSKSAYPHAYWVIESISLVFIPDPLTYCSLQSPRTQGTSKLHTNLPKAICYILSR